MLGPLTEFRKALECVICAWNPHPPCYRRAKHTLDRCTDHSASCTTPHNAHTFLAHSIRYALLHCRVHLDPLSGRVAPDFALHHTDRAACAHGEPKIVVIQQGKVEIGPLQVHKRPHSQRWVSTCSRAGWAGARARRAEHCATAWTRVLPTCTRPPLECNRSPFDGAPKLALRKAHTRHGSGAATQAMKGDDPEVDAARAPPQLTSLVHADHAASPSEARSVAGDDGSSSGGGRIRLQGVS